MVVKVSDTMTKLVESLDGTGQSEEKKIVKPENFNKLPSADQIYFYIHRAKEADDEFAIIPVRRGIAALGISKMKDEGKSYKLAVKALRTAIALRR